MPNTLEVQYFVESVHRLNIGSVLFVTRMGKRCASYGCRGNYEGEPYSKVVKFPKDEVTRQAWIDAMPNNPGTLKDRKEIYICATHFEGKWINVKGGTYPANPPSVFPGISKSCLRQCHSTPRQAVTSEVRAYLICV